MLFRRDDERPSWYAGEDPDSGMWGIASGSGGFDASTLLFDTKKECEAVIRQRYKDWDDGYFRYRHGNKVRKQGAVHYQRGDDGRWVEERE